MTSSYIAAAIVATLILLGAFLLWRRRRQPKQLDTAYFEERWQGLQTLCRNRKTWPDAVIQADDLLCEALKRSNYKGKTTGERLVAAQRQLSSNDTVWAGHKLRNSIATTDVRKLKKQDIVLALTGFRQALRDLGALNA